MCSKTLSPLPQTRAVRRRLPPLPPPLIITVIPEAGTKRPLKGKRRGEKRKTKINHPSRRRDKCYPMQHPSIWGAAKVLIQQKKKKTLALIPDKEKEPKSQYKKKNFRFNPPEIKIGFNATEIYKIKKSSIAIPQKNRC